MDMVITLPGGKKSYAAIRDFTIQTDQKPESGGENTAPTPMELFIASIGTCSSLYVLGFLKNRGFSADKVRLLLHADRDEETGLATKISISIELPPEVPEKYRPAIIKAAEKCLVSSHLIKPPQIVVTAA